MRQREIHIRKELGSGVLINGQITAVAERRIRKIFQEKRIGVGFLNLGPISIESNYNYQTEKTTMSLKLEGVGRTPAHAVWKKQEAKALQLAMKLLIDSIEEYNQKQLNEATEDMYQEMALNPEPS